MQGVSRGLDLPYSSEAEELEVGRPEELLVVPRVNQLLLNVANRALDVADKFTPIPAL